MSFSHVLSSGTYILAEEYCKWTSDHLELWFGLYYLSPWIFSAVHSLTYDQHNGTSNVSLQSELSKCSVFKYPW